MDFVYVGLGLVILILAGDALVRGAVNIALRLGIPALLVSMTIVAFGTSAPELLIAIKAVLDRAPDIAMGNVIGSNTANILLVLGVPALIAGLQTDGCDSRKSYVVMLSGSLLFIAICFVGPLIWWHGLILLAALALVLGDQARDAMAHRKNTATAMVGGAPEEDDEEVEGADPDMPWWRILLFLALGLAGLPLGADLLVDGATAVARDYGVAEAVIGLTLVAIGTSLPELATTVMAAIRRQADVALGNVIGSNLFNLLAIIGVAALVGPIRVSEEFLRFDLWVMLGASLILVPFVFLRWNLTKRWGILFSVLYVAYLWILIA